ncbi:segregation/condensation protein A [Mammaliicoccus sp. Dog046]|uniref:segregation and condensation protein A n=1 Tax=Mammaliicoccus sp. Dog046 TaxID=3034233 RepID=UPI002B25D919|nr:segregation/condensation protein A [Mammaliicoccus sp. Dog046]WQK84293.1 segregation/condensation protein A [Mammaliicoccus sp. Dog046]
MYEVKLDAFEGPLDLLLHLIQKYEIDIYDIPMKELTEQYLSYIHQMKILEINVASEYLVMASELLMIKSKLLLPTQPSDLDEYEDDPRDDLVKQLIEYQNYKAYAELLNDMKSDREQIFIKKPADLSNFEAMYDKRAPLDLNMTDLIVAYQRTKKRQRFNQPQQVTVSEDSYTIEMATASIESQLSKKKSYNFFESLPPDLTVNVLVTMFLAILEMMKLRQIDVFQQQQFGEITINRGVNYGS